MKSSLALLGILLVAAAKPGDGGKIEWRPGKQHDAALAEAKATGVPVVLYFTGAG